MDQTPNYQGTPYVPIYVMLPLDVVVGDANGNQVKAPGDLTNDLKRLKAVGVDGVMVDCWWGLVEGYPRQYHWSGYEELFQIVRAKELKLQVVMSFHACGNNVGDNNVQIPIPEWVTTNPDIFFTDQHGNRNPEYLSFGVDTEQQLFDRRTAIQIYGDFMKSFRQEFHEYFEDRTITGIQVGLGPCGELRYPSYPKKYGWKYPGIGEFQCYDGYLQRSLAAAAAAQGHQDWAHCPENAGEYNNRPSDTEFFRDDGDYDSEYGRFFVNWYAQTLIEHGDRVLALARDAFNGTPLSAKVSGVHWLYRTRSHAAELTAGYNNSSNRGAYAPVATMLAEHDVALDFTCLELRTRVENLRNADALSDPERLVSQVLNAAWAAGVKPAAENALPCYDRDSYNQILSAAKPADGRYISAFTYLRLDNSLLEHLNLTKFTDFVKRLHGEAQPNNPHLT